MPRSLALLLAAWFMLFSSAAAFAQPAPRAKATLLLDTDKLVPGQQAIAAIVVDIEEGYHAQSSRPLDENFIAFTATMTAGEGVKVLDALYAPGDLHDFPALGGKLSVYEGHVITFVPFVVADDAKPGEIELKAKVRLQICNDEACDPPGNVFATATTPIVAKGEKTTSTNTTVFARFDPIKWLHEHPLPTDATTQSTADAPTKAEWVHYSEVALAEARRSGKPVIVKFTAAWCVTCHVVERNVFGDAATLAELAKRGAILVKVDLTQEGAPGSELLASLSDSRSIPFTAVYYPGKEKPATLFGIYDSAALLKLMDDGGASQQSQTSLAGIELKDLSWPVVALLALGVGVLLNCVPCVLPVLPLKAASFYEDAGHSRGKSFTYGLAFSAGIVAMFGGLTLFVILSGSIWSKAISNPYVVGVVTVVLVLAALQAFGALELVLPGSITRLEAASGTYAGNFFSGALIAILSTPCTVGIFAAVIAFALKSGATIGTVILMAAGAGMALPWLALSALPEITRKFPRTGPWPAVIKQMMGFLLLATAIFFSSPLFDHRYQPVIWWLIFACVAASAIFLLARTFKLAPRPRPIAISSTVAVLLTVAGFGMTKLFGG